jgi:hypothetical protein
VTRWLAGFGSDPEMLAAVKRAADSDAGAIK